MASAAILNSRQSKTPSCKDDWAVNTVAAVMHAVEMNEWDIVSSVGMFTWDYVTWLAATQGGMVELVVPRAIGTDGRELTQEITRDFALVSERVRWHFVDVAAADLDSKKWWPQRDRQVIETANIILPVSLRPDGSLAQLLTRAGKPLRIDYQFEALSYEPETHHLRTLIDSTQLTDSIQDWTSDWLIHWTRTCHGPWPGETKAQFFENFMEWRDGYCHSGFRTLLHILQEGRIRASARRIGEKLPVVAFTDLSPVESLPLMRWRPRWTNWAFEPYGIAIHRDAAAALGIRSVRYVPADEWKNVPAGEKPFTHSIGKSEPIWPAECEWRCAGDVDLTGLPADALRVLVRSRDELPAVNSLCSSKVLAFMNEAPDQ